MNMFKGYCRVLSQGKEENRQGQDTSRIRDLFSKLLLKLPLQCHKELGANE